MVKAFEVTQSNVAFVNQKRSGAVCVFVGATSGIGARTLERMMTMFQRPTMYFLGRSPVQFQSQRKTLEALNRDAKIVFIETDVALIGEIDRASRRIMAEEKQVDFSYRKLNSILDTAESLEANFAISYFSRLRLVSNLLPLLDRAPAARVLSVLNGGKEKRLLEDDVGLNQNWTMFNLIKHSTCLTSLAFVHLAVKHPSVTLIHSFPGLVESDNVRRSSPSDGASFARRVLFAVVKGIVAIIRYFIGITPKESGERQTYHLTSGIYSPVAWRIHQDSKPAPANKTLEQYEANGWPDKVWTFTTETWSKAVAMGGQF